MNLRRLLVLAVLLAAVVAVAGCGGTTLQVQPAAATKATSSPSPGAGGCDASPWTGAISPQGRPDGLDAGDAGAVYLWHDGDGWHIRATDRRPVDHHYTGTVRLLPSAESFVDVRPVRDERDD